MAALIDTMFSYRETPWHKMGQILESAPTSADAIVAAGLDWTVQLREVYQQDEFGHFYKIEDQFATVRDKDNETLGVVGSRYQIVQNVEAFDFTDELIGEGCVYETAGSLRNGKTIWLLAHLPEAMQIAGDSVMPYLCFTNTHDGTGAVKVFCTSIRVVCNNTLNAALSAAKRTWSARHTGSIDSKLAQATQTLQLANKYMDELKKSCEQLALKNIDNDKLIKYINLLLPEDDDMTKGARENLRAVKNDIWIRYSYAPDLVDREQTMLRFLQAVSDTASHRDPNRLTKNWRENRFMNLVSGNEMIDKAYQIAVAA